MTFAGVNYLAVIIAAIVAFAFGGAWYTVLGKSWMAALGKTEAELRGRGLPMPARFGIALLGLLVMAYMLAGVIGHLGQNQVTVKNGVISAVFLWIGFVMTALSVNYAFQNQKGRLWLVDGAHWLGVLVIEGAIIGAMGV